MSFDRIVEAIIKEALERGEFDNLPGKGKAIDLTEYVDLLKEIAELKQILVAILDETKKQVEFSLMMERQKRLGRRR